MALSPTKQRKWIEARIEELDPEVDYVEIYRLMSTYQPGTFVLDLMYAYAFPHFMVSFHGSEPVWRDGGHKSKVIQRASLRSDDTLLHNLIWMHYGPDHPETQKSVDEVNKIHAHYAKTYPDSFARHEDYVYVWCFSAALMHRLMLQMGLPGYTEKQKIVAHRFWKEMAPLFVVPGDPRPVEGYPDDFDGILTWLAEFESRDFPYNEIGGYTSQAVLDQFLQRRVPRPLHPLLRAVVYSFFADSVMTAYRLQRPHPAIAAVLRRSCGLAMALANRLAPDPDEDLIELRNKMTDEERREHRAKMKEDDASFAQAFTSVLRRSRPAAPEAAMSCPYPMANRAATAGREESA